LYGIAGSYKGSTSLSESENFGSIPSPAAMTYNDFKKLFGDLESKKPVSFFYVIVAIVILIFGLVIKYYFFTESSNETKCTIITENQSGGMNNVNCVEEITSILDGEFLSQLSQTLVGYESKDILVMARMGNDNSFEHAKQVFDYLKVSGWNVGQGLSQFTPSSNDVIQHATNTFVINRGVNPITIKAYR